MQRNRLIDRLIAKRVAGFLRLSFSFFLLSMPVSSFEIAIACTPNITPVKMANTRALRIKKTIKTTEYADARENFGSGGE